MRAGGRAGGRVHASMRARAPRPSSWHGITVSLHGARHGTIPAQRGQVRASIFGERVECVAIGAEPDGWFTAFLGAAQNSGAGAVVHRRALAPRRTHAARHCAGVPCRVVAVGAGWNRQVPGYAGTLQRPMLRCHVRCCVATSGDALQRPALRLQRCVCNV